MALLLASLVALFVGPALVHVMGRRQGAVAAIDGFVVVAIGGLVLFHIVPHSVADVGWPALIAAGVGLLLPALYHPPLSECGERRTVPLLSLSVLAIACHAFLDGVGLVDPSHDGAASAVGIAIVLHRVLEGLGIWWLVRSHYGRRGTIAVVSTIAVATVCGYLGADWAQTATSERVIGLVQVTVAGSLLHVLMRHAPARADGDARHLPTASALGGIAAVALLVALGHFHQHGAAVEVEPTTAQALFVLATRAAPALLVAYVMVALFHAAAPAASRILQRGGLASMQALRGTGVGLSVAVCSCGVLPLYRNLLGRHTPPAAAMAYLVAAPALGFAAVLLSLVFLGGEMTLLRAGACAWLAWGIGTWVSRGIPQPSETAALPERAVAHRLADGVHFAFGEVLDHSAPWVTLGLVSAACIASTLQPNLFAELPAGGEVLFMTLAGAPMYWSASAATLVAAVFLSKGVSFGAVLSFMLSGSATGITTTVYLARAHGRGRSAIFTTCVLAGSVAAGLLANRVSLVAPGLDFDATPSLWQMAALGVLAALVLVSLLRQGVRSFLEQVVAPNALMSHSEHHAHTH